MENFTSMYLYIAIILAQDNCTKYDFPRVLENSDTTLTNSYTERGLHRFIDCGISEALNYLKQVQFPEIVEDINLGASSI